MLGSIISFALFLLLIFLCVRGIMWGASLMILLQGAFSSFVIAMVIMFALPTEGQVIGPKMSYLPLCVSGVVAVAAVLSIFFAQKSQNTASGRHHKIGIIVVALGGLLWVVGFTAFSLFVFGGLPEGADPKAAEISFSVFCWAGAITFYFATKCESVGFPNVYRWLTFFASCFLVSAVFVCSMIYLFAFPDATPTTHPFWAAVNSVNYIPIALLFIALNRSYVKRNAAGAAVEEVEDSFELEFE